MTNNLKTCIEKALRIQAFKDRQGISALHPIASAVAQKLDLLAVNYVNDKPELNIYKLATNSMNSLKFYTSIYCTHLFVVD